MGSANLVSVVLFQGDASSSDHMQWLVIFVGVIAFCSFVQFLVLVGSAIAALKAWKTVSAEIDAVKQKAFPLVASIQDVVNDASPKVRTITDNVAHISTISRNKLQDFEVTIDRANDTIREANDKTRAQVARVDGMVSSALKATSDVSNTIHRGIRTPVMEVAGIINGLKAGLDVLVGRAREFTGDRSAEVPGTSARYSAPRATASSPYPAPRPAYVSPSAPATSSHPSSNVAPSPGAAAIADKLRSDEKIKSIS